MRYLNVLTVALAVAIAVMGAMVAREITFVQDLW